MILLGVHQKIAELAISMAFKQEEIISSMTITALRGLSSLHPGKLLFQ